MQKRTMKKLTWKLIRTTRSRFFSLTAIVTLGMAFFVGVSASSDLMAANVDAYDDRLNLKDITIYSDYGFDEQDIEAVKDMEGVEGAEGSKFTDVIAGADGVSLVARVHSYDPEDTINRFVLVEGRLPQNDNEILAEKGIDLAEHHFHVNDRITFQRPNDDLDEQLQVSEATIVGLIDTPLYLDDAKETSTLNNRDLNTYFYIPESAFALDVDTELNVTLKDGKSFNTFSKAYRDFAKEKKEEIEELGKNEADARLKRIKDDAMEEYDKGRKEYEDGVQELKDKTEEAQQKLDDSQSEIDEGRQELAEGIDQLNEARNALQEKAEEGKNGLDAAEAQLINGQKQLDAGREEYQENEEKYSAYIAQIDAGIAQLNQQQEALKQPLPMNTPLRTLASGSPQMQSLMEQLNLGEDADLQAASDACSQQSEQLGTLSASLNSLVSMKGSQVSAQGQQLQASADGLQGMIDSGQLPAETPVSVLLQGEQPVISQEEISTLGLSEESSVQDLIAAMNSRSAMLSGLGSVLKETPEENSAIPVSVFAQTGILDASQISPLLEAGGLDENAPLSALISAVEAQKKQLDQTEQMLSNVTLPDETPLSALMSSGAMSQDSLEQLNLTPENSIGDLKAAIDAKINELNSQKKQIQDGLSEGAEQLSQGAQQLEEGRRKLEAGRVEYNTSISDAWKQINDAQAEADANQKKLIDAQAELEDGRKTLEEKTNDAQSKLDDAKKKLDDALKDIEDLKENKWTVLDRTSHYATAAFQGTVDQMAAIAAIFPVFFLAVAALVCLTTMTRLVDENRNQTATMRALGYTPGDCSGIYLTYAALAALIGIVVGTVLGMSTISLIIYYAWQMMYALPKLHMIFPWKLIAVSAVSFMAVMLGSTAYALNQERREVPAQLMRPKSPKLGKSVFLERIPVIWKNLSFTGKVTARNLIRYKKRFLMTIIGVAGCTALLMTGFGVRDSVSGMVSRQYDVISHSDGIVTLTDDKDISRVEELLKQEGVSSTTAISSWQAKVEPEGESRTVSVEVFQDDVQAAQAFTLRECRTKEPLSLNEDGVIINQKLAELLDAEAGDEISLEGKDGTVVRARISAVCEMYLSNYLFLSQKEYQNLFHKEPQQNTLLVSGIPDEEKLASVLESQDSVEGITFTSASRKNFDTMVASLAIIVWVLIISSMSLAVVVLGNLTNINIAERTREIATLKVLGFRKKEVQNYIYKENNILVFLGALAGLPLGTLLHHAIMNQVEMDYMMFQRTINARSYAICFILTLLFGLLVNFLMRKKLLRIDMVESLKSVE